MSETSLQRQLMLHWSESGMRLFRNNCGQLQDARGHYVRYGVCNPGGSDLLGWTPLIITPEMAGRTVAVFTAIETKVGTRTATAEQVRFIAAVQLAGGLSVVAREVDDVARALARLLA